MKKKIQYCKECLYPNTKPNLFFDHEGICSACNNFKSRDKIDWANRKKQFEALIDNLKKSKSNYNCLIPVSGGKDSTYQVLKILEYGLNPLCVTASTCSLSEIGRENIKNLQFLGVDHVEITLNPKIRKKINKLALKTIGDISWPEHALIFTIPIHVAIQNDINTIIWGENSQFEYGGPENESEKKILDYNWLQEFGGLNGLRVSDLEGQENITSKDLHYYTYPDKDLLNQKQINGHYLGYYFQWNSLKNREISKKNGFKTWNTNVEGAIFDCENLDNYQAGIHEYFCFLKFGFSRATAQASMLIRRKQLLRNEALKQVKDVEGKFPEKFLGRKLEKILDEIDMSLNEFIQVCDRFTNKKIFQTDENGNLIKDNKLGLKKINYDN
tara:strand:+ start:2308 stop:3462 length:1155 start_codon:yes stop_codon:yes gene_type:complete